MPDDLDNLTDDQVLEQLQAQDDMELPELEDSNESDADKHDKKIRHAFAEQKRAGKQALGLAEKYKEELEDLKKEKEQQSSNPPPNAGGADQAVSVLNALTVTAMQNLGISEVSDGNRELVVMERNRLYSAQVDGITERKRAESDAPEIVSGILSEIPQLDDSDITEMKKRLGEIDVVQRTDRKVIMGEVHKYLGEKILVGDSGATNSSSSAGEGESQPDPHETSTANAAAVSSVKSGRKGVGARPGKSAGGSNEPAPATPEEVTQMKAMRVTDLAVFREAKNRASNYKGR